MADIKVAMISLGCAKNLVDSEQMLYRLKNAGYVLSENAEGADVVVVNTCGFIEDAKREAIENILQLAELKKEGKIGAIIAAGCLAQRYKDEFFKELPEVDAIVGTGSYSDITEAVKAVTKGGKSEYFSDIDTYLDEGERILATPRYSAYLKIAEGCDNRCAYCVIPSIRGKYRSRKMENIIKEAKELSNRGVKEIIVIAQDITRYGTDICGERKLHELLDKISDIDGIEWVRLHYLYPDEIDERLIDTIARNDKIVKYFDIPVQHASDRILSTMNRRGDSNFLRKLFSDIRRKMPDAVLRTSFITGLPGETDEDFDILCRFAEDIGFERAGVFAFSPEEGSKAFDMPDQVDHETAVKRQEILQQILSRGADKFGRRMTGKTMRVLCEGFNKETGMFYGRSYADSPDIDGTVYFESNQKIKCGEFADVMIKSYEEYDMTGIIAG